MRALPVLLLAVALSAPAPAVAASLRPWIGFNGSQGKYTMGDLNRELDDVNTRLNGTSLHLWPVGIGPGCGASAGVDFGPGLSVGIGYDRVFASSGTSDSLDGYAMIRLPASAYRGIVEYAFPHKGKLAAHIGAAAGQLRVTGQLVADTAFDVRGTAPFYEAYLGGDWWGQPRCVVFATVGYRSARVKEVKIGGVVETNPDGSKFRLDYSGTLMRIGVKVPLGAPAGAAAHAPDSAGGRVVPWVGVNGSWGTRRMTDINLDLTGLGVKKIQNGAGFGGTAGLDLPGPLTLGAGYDWLAASSKASVSGGSVDYRLPANAVRGFLEFRLPARGALGTRLGIAGGAVMEARSARITNTTPGSSLQSGRVRASGPLAEGYATGEWRTGSRLAATATLGYRYARAGEIKRNGEVYFKTLRNVQLFIPYTADYSGLFARVGVKVALTR